jgi:hypothetical protein
MTTHLSARLAWHMDGWNSHVCRNPAGNRFCIGPHSYPGDKIKGTVTSNGTRSTYRDGW